MTTNKITTILISLSITIFISCLFVLVVLLKKINSSPEIKPEIEWIYPYEGDVQYGLRSDGMVIWRDGP